MPSALVVGGAGFVGSHLCDRLLRHDWYVTCIDNLLTGSRRNLQSAADVHRARFRFLKQDITDGVFSLPPLDVVFCLASPASPVDYLRYPLETLRAGSEGTRNALEIARMHNARFILTSTSEVYGDPLEHPQHESYWGNVNPIGMRSCYDEAKRYAEAVTLAYHRQYQVNVGIARLFNTYGPRMRTNDGRVVPTFINRALLDEPIPVAGDGVQTRSFTYVDDVIDGLIKLMQHNDFVGPVNLGSTDEMTITDLAFQIVKLIRSSSDIVYTDRMPDDPERRRPDITLARNTLGWAPHTSLGFGMQQTIDWFRAQMEVTN